MADNVFWVGAVGDETKTYEEVTPSGVKRSVMYSRKGPARMAAAPVVVASDTPPNRIYKTISKKMAHPSSRFAAPPGGLKMRNRNKPYKSTGFKARPSRSKIANAALLPTRIIASASKMPRNFCYTPSDLTAVRDQGACGSCWSVSATSMIADRVNVMTRGKIRCALSYQQLMECAAYIDGGEPVGCEGNDPFTAIKAIKDKPLHIVSENKYPRLYTGQPSEASKCIANPNPEGYAVTSTEAFMLTDPIPLSATEDEKAKIIKGNVENMKQSLYNEGPLVVVFAVPSDFPDYDGLSIYEPPAGFQAETSNSWHAVELVGWGTSGKDQYWICRNSWGAKWPANHKKGAGMGFFYISMGKNTCAIEQYAVGIVPKTVNPSKADKTPNNMFPGEFVAPTIPLWLKLVAVAAIGYGGYYGYKKYGYKLDKYMHK